VHQKKEALKTQGFKAGDERIEQNKIIFILKESLIFNGYSHFYKK